MSTELAKLPASLIKEADQRTAGKRKWRLTSPMVVQWGEFLITIPAGFVTDGTSIPRAGRSIIQKDGPHKIGAVFHDWLYKCAGVVRVVMVGDLNKNEFDLKYDRGDADYGYRNFMAGASRLVGGVLVHTHVGAPARYTIISLLRGFGFMAWWKHRRAKKKQR